MKIVTGDRPTGCLHLGHLVGSLQKRIELQNEHTQYLLIANLQALTDNFDKARQVEENIYKVFASYLAVGLDYDKNTFLVQSSIPEFAELTMYFMNLVSLERTLRNPTIKEELKQKKFDKNPPLGFILYPVSQAADILLFHGTGVPVGNDQLPILEQTNEIARAFNTTYKTDYFSPCKAILSDVQRLIGSDGKKKMSKSLKNAIYLDTTDNELEEIVMKMYTDPNHIKISDPGTVENNTVFTYLDIFHREKEEVEALKAHYRKGGLGDVSLKRTLYKTLNELLAPIRERYFRLYQDKKNLKELLYESTKKGRQEAQRNIEAVRSIMGIFK
jgi:tryptophanyl-tRNA synthetase